MSGIEIVFYGPGWVDLLGCLDRDSILRSRVGGPLGLSGIT